MSKSKYDGIDERVIKCCDDSSGTIEAGISFDEQEDKNDKLINVLRFHFLDYLPNGMLTQKTKSMFLNKENTQQLITELQNLNFD